MYTVQEGAAVYSETNRQNRRRLLIRVDFLKECLSTRSNKVPPKASYLRVKNIVAIHAYTKHHFYYVHKGR